MPTIDSAKLYGNWLGLWNGDLSFAEKIVAADCVIHHPAIPARTEKSEDGAAQMAALVREGRAPFRNLVFTLEVGPVEEGDKLAARWTARGSYAGGMSDVKAPEGTTVIFSGADFFRIRDGKIAEYWGSSDSLQLMQQLGAAQTTTPAGTGS